MRSVNEHLSACLDVVGQLPPLAVALSDAVGCVLAEDVRAPADSPITDLAGCDGYAVNTSVLTDSRVRVMDEVRAGAADRLRLVGDSVVRIASGAPMPIGADAVIPLEATDQGDATVTFYQAVRAGENVRGQAGDAASGDVVLSAGQRVGARQIALLAAIGRGRVLVHPKPRVVIVSVGDELLEPGRPAESGQVFDANGHALATGVHDVGGVALRVGAVPDRVRELRETLEDQLVRADLIVTTGGLSAGDTVRDVVSSLGTVRFDNVAIEPGRRFGVGHVDDGATPILCLPGDPVAVQVAYETFVRPTLRTMAGYSELFRPSVRASAGESWNSTEGVRQFMPVTIMGTATGGYRCVPVGENLTNLAQANALAVVPEQVAGVPVGFQVDCLILDA